MRAALSPFYVCVAEADLTHEEALAVLRESNSKFVTRMESLPGARVTPMADVQIAALTARSVHTSALELLQYEQRRRYIRTGCRDLDELLGGGVAPGEITECAELAHVAASH